MSYLKDLSAFIVLMDASRNTYYSLLQDVKNDSLKNLEAINPENKKHKASIESKKRQIINRYEKTLKAFEKDMVGLIDSIKLADNSKERCIEAGVDIVAELMDKTFYSDEPTKVKTGAFLLESLKQKMFQEKEANTVALNYGEVILRIPAESWKLDHEDFKGVTVRVIDGQKFVEL